jgi:hypothetical protein
MSVTTMRLSQERKILVVQVLDRVIRAGPPQAGIR